jgi:hypothetical protein
MIPHTAPHILLAPRPEVLPLLLGHMSPQCRSEALRFSHMGLFHPRIRNTHICNRITLESRRLRMTLDSACRGIPWIHR